MLTVPLSSQGCHIPMPSRSVCSIFGTKLHFDHKNITKMEWLHNFLQFSTGTPGNFSVNSSRDSIDWDLLIGWTAWADDRWVLSECMSGWPCGVLSKENWLNTALHIHHMPRIAHVVRYINTSNLNVMFHSHAYRVRLCQFTLINGETALGAPKVAILNVRSHHGNCHCEISGGNSWTFFAYRTGAYNSNSNSLLYLSSHLPRRDKVKLPGVKLN